jgi:hypothetical protein
MRDLRVMNQTNTGVIGKSAGDVGAVLRLQAN